MPSVVASAEVAARRSAARGLRVRRPLSIADCARKYRKLSVKEASESGDYDPARTPFLIAIMESLQETHSAEVCIFKKPTQIGGTSVGQNWICWTFLESPASMMVTLPTEKVGLRWVRSKLRTMVRATPSLRRMVPLGTRRRARPEDDDEQGTMQEIHAGQTVVYITSANIGSDLRMVACRRLLLDEVDEMPKELPGQGDPVELVLERFKTYNGRRKAFITSTPTDDESRIDKEYQDSSQGEYFVPCPQCAEMQALEWERLKYTAASECSDAHYVCVNGCIIEEHHKTEMLARGEWRHRRPELVDFRIGFALNCLYTPLGLGDRWQDNARKYERARRDPAKLRAFENTRLGRVHRGQSVRFEPEELKRRVFDYELRTIPEGTLLLTAFGDVQVDRVEIQVIGWSRGERIATVDYVVIPGAPTGDEVWRAVDEYLATPIMNSFGVAMPIECALIDAGNWQHEVTNFTRGLRHRRIFASKGSSVKSKVPIGRPTMVDVKYRGKVDQRGAELYMVGAHVLKNTLFTRLRADGDTIDEIVKDGREYGPDDVMVRFPKGLEDEFFEQMTAEKYDAGKGAYVPIRDRNEALDTMVGAMAAGYHHSIAVHRFRELEWQRREVRFQIETAPKAKESELGKTAVRVRGGFLPVPARTDES